MKKNIIFVLLLLVSLSFCSWYMPNVYLIKEPWDDYNWIEGKYTAAVCVDENRTFSAYTGSGSRLPELPSGTFVSILDSGINNHMSYTRDRVSYNKPRREAYSCDCDIDGCSTCYRCTYDNVDTSVYGIGYSKGAWDLNLYNDAITSIELENLMVDIDGVEGVSGDLLDISFDFGGDVWGVKNYLRHAYERYLTVQELYETCRNSDSYSTNQYLANNEGDKSISFENFLAVYDPKTVSIPGSPCNVDKPSNPAGAECKNYPLRWMDSVEFAINALEASFISSTKNIYSLRNTYDDLEETGICDDDYPENPKTACDRIESALNIIDSEDSGEGTFGQYERALEREKDLQLSLYCFPPDFTEYKEIMVLLWKENDGFNPLVMERKEEGEAAYEEANRIYSNYVGQAQNYTEILNAKEGELEDNNLELIRESKTAFGVVEALESVGTIAERAGSFSEELSEADSSYGEALRIFGGKRTDYLKDATLQVRDALELYSGLEDEAGSILENAEDIVEDKGQTAETLVQQAAALYQRTQSLDVRRYYQTAQQELDRGDSTSVLGDKYQHYINAAEYARIALNNGEILENETMPLVNQLEDLIRRAEIDEINVGNEEDILGYMEDTGEYDNAVLRELIESIIRKAGIKYGHLSDVKEELLQNISDSGGCAEGLLGDVERVDDGLVTTTGIDYINAVGRLKDIEEEYGLISEDVLACGVEMILENLHISSSVRVYEDIKIDEPTKMSVTILITNLGRRNAVDVDVPVELEVDIPILMSDIRGGKENVAGVRTEEGRTIFTITEIKPYRTFSIVIEKTTVLAETVEVERTGIGNSDGSVDVTEELTFDLHVRGTIAGSQTGVLESGRHTITRNYRIEDGYSIEEEVETYKLGTSVQVEKRIRITPNLDISILPFTVELDYPAITGLAISARGTSITDNQCGSTDSICSIDLGDLNNGEEATVFVDFIVVNAEDLLPTITTSIPDTEDCFGTGKSCGPLPSGLGSMIAEMNAAIDVNDTATAIMLKEELESKIDEWNRQQERTYNELTELKVRYEVEISEIESALEGVTSNTTLVNSLNERKNELENALIGAEEATDIVSALNILESVTGKGTGEIINDFMKNVWDAYNDLKVRLANAGVSTMPQEFIVVENKFSALETSKEPKTAIELAEALENAEDFVEFEEERALAEIGDIYSQYDEISEELDGLITTYNEQLAEAEGTEWETLFGLNTDRIESLVEETGEYLDEKNIKMAKIKIEQLEKKKSIIEDVLDEIKDSAETNFLYARNTYEGKKDGLPGEIKTEIENELAAMAGEITEGKYIQAMQRGKQVLDKLVNYNIETINPLLIILAVAAVGAAVGVYYMRKKGGGEIGEMEIKLPFLTKKKKEYKKLARAEV